MTGDSLNGLSDSLHRLDEIRWMGKWHEEAAAFAAGAEELVTGDLSVFAPHAGRNVHLINGLFHSRLTPHQSMSWRIVSEGVSPFRLDTQERTSLPPSWP